MTVLPYLVWFGLASALPPDHDAFRRTELAAERAVQANSGEDQRRRWERALGARPDDEQALFGLATLARLRYDYAAAERLFQRLGSPADSSRPAVLHATLGRALVHLTRWDRDSGLVVAERAARWARAQRDPGAEARAHLIAARFAGRRFGLDSATRLVQRAADVAPARDTSLMAWLTCMQSSAIRSTDPARAVQLAERGVGLARAAGDRRMEGRCLHAMGSALEAEGSGPRARAAFARAAAVHGEAHDDDGRAAALQWLAYTTIQGSDSFPAGRRYAEEAIALARRSGNRQVLAWAELNLAQLAIKLGDPSTTSRLASDSRGRMRELGDRFGESQAWMVAGDAAYLGGRLTDAETAYTTCDTLLLALKLDVQRPSVLLRLAGVRRERGDLAAAAATLERATRIASATGAAGNVGDARYERGLQQLARGRWAGAIREFESFRGDAGASFDLQVLDAELRIAEAKAGAGDFDGADRAVDAAVRALDRVRAGLASREAQVQLLQARRWDFDPDLGVATLVDRYVRAGRVAAAFRVVEMQRSRRLQAALAGRRLLGGDSAAGEPSRAALLDLARVQAAVPPGSAVLSFVTGRGGEPSTAFLLTARGTTTFAVPPADSLVEPIQRLVSLLERGAGAEALGRSLGSALLAPALRGLTEGTRRLVIVPDGPLHRLPFDALVLVDGRRALQRFAISYAPAARLAVAPRPSPPSRARGVAFGDARFAPAAGLPPLPGSGVEARRVAAVVRGDSELGSAATEASLRRRAAEGPPIVHLATHAQVEDWGLLSSALFLSPDATDDGRLGAEEIAGLRLAGGLVMLSGCRTAGGVVTNGEGLQGLAGPFLEAGARAVAATHWAVGDRSITPLVEAFYRELAAGRSAADALQRAKLARMAAGDSAAVWAAVVLLGDGDFAPLARPGSPRS